MIPELRRTALVDVDPFVRDRVNALAAVISSTTGVTIGAILGRRRFPKVVEARRQLMLSLWHDGLSLKEVGLVLGFHHTSVMHLLRLELGAVEYQAEVLARYSKSRRGSYRGAVAA